MAAVVGPWLDRAFEHTAGSVGEGQVLGVDPGLAATGDTAAPSAAEGMVRRIRSAGSHWVAEVHTGRLGSPEAASDTADP